MPYFLALYHSEKLQSTKTPSARLKVVSELYHSEKLQSTKTDILEQIKEYQLYHSEKLQSTKTPCVVIFACHMLYHSEKLQSTKTSTTELSTFIIFRYDKSINKKTQIIRPVLKFHKKH